CYLYAILNILDLGDVREGEKLQAKLPSGRSEEREPGGRNPPLVLVSPSKLFCLLSWPSTLSVPRWFIVPPRAARKCGESPRAAFHRAPETRIRGAGHRGSEPGPATSVEWHWRARSIRAWLPRRDRALR